MAPKRGSEPARRGFDAELAALEGLRESPREVVEPLLRKALGNRSNFLVAKAANLALHHGLTGLTAELVAAFRRFLDDAVKTDPQCWAKNAAAKALAQFEYQEAELFLAGMRHTQLEPGWGGPTDTAGPLRGTCALALVQCRELNSHRLLMALLPLFADKELAVRVNVARAVEQVGTDSAALLLRLRAELGSAEGELLGACYAGVLSIEGPGALGWAARFLSGEDDAAGEAALAIAGTHTPEAFRLLRERFARARDAWFWGTVLSAIALTRQEEAAEWLLGLVAAGGEAAASAQEALCRSAPSVGTLERLRELGRPCR